MVTQAQIAEQLGVSRQLVTFALSGHPHVAESSRELILAKAKEMGYRPNPYARALKRKKTGIVALWIPDQVSGHFGNVSRNLTQLVKESGHELIVAEIGGRDVNQVWSNVPVDGIFAIDNGNLSESEFDSLAGNTVPIVGLGAYYSEKFDSIQVDLATGAAEAMKHLLDSGYKRIAHATFIDKDLPNASRRREYSNAMREAGLPPEFIIYPFSENQRAVTRQLIQEYIADHGLPEAIFCHSDDAALGIYRGLCDLKIRVPDQVALVGCDGIEDTMYLEVPLSTLVQPVKEMCSKAWQFLKDRMDDPSLPPRHVSLPPRLDIRDSSRRPS